MRKTIFYYFTKKFIDYQFHPAFVIAAMLLEKTLGLAIYDYKGIKVAAGPVGYLDRFIILDRDINPHLPSVLKQQLQDGGVFLDIGANHGVLSLLAAKNPKTKVFAFEPSPRELSRLWKNFSYNHTNNISVLAYGLSDTEKTQDLCLFPTTNSGKNSLPGIIKDKQRVKCHFSTLDKLLTLDLIQQTRVCKIDIEGQEMFFLKSLEPHLHLLHQCIFVIEINAPLLIKVGFKHVDIYDLFAKAGFVSQFDRPKKDEDNDAEWDEIFYHPIHTTAPFLKG